MRSEQSRMYLCTVLDSSYVIELFIGESSNGKTAVSNTVHERAIGVQILAPLPALLAGTWYLPPLEVCCVRSNTLFILQK